MMLTKEQDPSEPWGHSVESRGDSWGPINEMLATVNFVLALLLMCIYEAIVIHGLWFRLGPFSYNFKMFEIPLSALMPAFLGAVVRVQIRRQSKVGQISLRAASALNVWLSLLLLLTYIGFLNIADYSFY